MITMNVLQDSSELIPYNNPRIPLYVGKNKLSCYPGMKALCHWHEDIEYIKPTNGHMSYYVNGEKIIIKENDALLINARQMHYAASDDKNDCTFIGILFRPQTLTNISEIKDKYITPILNQVNLPYYYLDSSYPAMAEIIGLFDSVYKIFLEKEQGYELTVFSILLDLWKKWYCLLESVFQEHSPEHDDSLLIQKNMITFIQQNYTAKITLQDIAASGKICRSKCCKIFKKYLHQTPMDFVTACRLEASIRLLQETSTSITEIALSCGFQSPSYYAEVFRQRKGCSPSEYRLNFQALPQS